MVEVVLIDPNGKMPSEDADFIQIVRRFETDQPQKAMVDVNLFVSATGQQQSLTAACVTGDPDDMAAILKQAMEIAEERNIETIYLADMTAPDWR